MTALEHMTSVAASASSSGVLVLPVGATEQHGPHLPMTTDTEIAVALAGRLAAVVPGVVVAPPLAYGSSGEHQDFPGTLSIGGPATERVLVELGRSASCTWSRLLVLCCHGGNAQAVRGAVRRLRDEGRDARAWFPAWDGDAHAGHVETSIMMALAPERVDLTRAAVGERRPLREIASVLRRDGVSAVSPNGILGDATAARADVGELLLRQATTELAAMLRGWT